MLLGSGTRSPWGEVGNMGAHARRQLDLPVVARNHHAAPRLGEEQGRMALSLGLALEAAATVLAPEQTRALERCRRRRPLRLALTVYALEIAAGVVAAGAVAGWW